MVYGYSNGGRCAMETINQDEILKNISSSLQATKTNGSCIKLVEYMTYNAMRQEAIYRTLDSSPIAAAIMTYLDQHVLGAEFTTAKNALDALVQYYTDGESWPRSGKGLTEAIKRLAPAFRQIGIRTEVGKQRNKNGYPVIIKPLEPFKATMPDSINKVIHPPAFKTNPPKVAATA